MELPLFFIIKYSCRRLSCFNRGVAMETECWKSKDGFVLLVLSRCVHAGAAWPVWVSTVSLGSSHPVGVMPARSADGVQLTKLSRFLQRDTTILSWSQETGFKKLQSKKIILFFYFFKRERKKHLPVFNINHVLQVVSVQFMYIL